MIDNATRQHLARLLEGKREPDLDDTKAIQALARDILLTDLDTLTEEIQQELGRWKQSRAEALDFAGRQYYKFVAPPSEDKPRLVYENKDTEFYEPIQRQTYKVRVRDLAAFCKAHGLREKEMVRVGMGEIRDHRGWERSREFGDNFFLGQPYMEPRPEVPQDTPAGGRKERRMLFRYALPDLDWLPGADK